LPHRNSQSRQRPTRLHCDDAARRMTTQLRSNTRGASEHGGGLTASSVTKFRVPRSHSQAA
jgi:hypothetical protein